MSNDDPAVLAASPAEGYECHCGHDGSDPNCPVGASPAVTERPEVLHWSYYEDDECIEDCPGCLREEVIAGLSGDEPYVGELDATDLVDLLLRAVAEQPNLPAAPAPAITGEVEMLTKGDDGVWEFVPTTATPPAVTEGERAACPETCTRHTTCTKPCVLPDDHGGWHRCDWIQA